MGTAYTKIVAKILGYHAMEPIRFTRQRITAIDGNVPNANVAVRFTQFLVRAMTKVQDDDPNTELPEGISITQLRCKVLRLRTPNFRWIEMFVDELFPFDISYHSQAKTVFMTDVTMVDSGFTQRRSRWTQPLMSYDIAYGVRTREQLHGLMQFFWAMEGRKHAFRYKDPMDCTSNFAVATEARGVPPISMNDQELGVGDGDTFQFQLRKAYRAGSMTKWRPIYKPESGTVQVSLNAVEATNRTIDHSTGLVTFTPRIALNLSGVTVTAVSAGVMQFDIGTTAFNAFTPGERLETGGFVHPANNTVSSQFLTVTSVTEGGSRLTTNRPTDFGVAASGQNGVVIRTHPAPAVGVIVRAGYVFHVPVRFDVDELPMDFEDYGIGSALNVKLIEVRPSEEEL